MSNFSESDKAVHSKCISYSLKLLNLTIEELEHNKINKTRLKLQHKNKNFYQK